MDNQMKLTQTVQKGGCAAKVSAGELRKILKQVQFPKAHPELLVDGGLFDDAAIYKITPEIAMVQTLDFFTPIVDTPRIFGEIAAANALSDVYAMGGRPKTAMAILAFPLATFSNEVIIDILQGASDKIQEAQANFVGGHSIDDETLKFGLSVTGYVHPQKIWSNNKAKVGDVLILTKPLGTGTLTAALKRSEVTEKDIDEALQSMSRLNRAIDFLNPELLDAIHAATDITGFGLSGHSMQLAQASQVTLQIFTDKIPSFALAKKYLEAGFLTKAHRTNSEYTSHSIDTEKMSPIEKLLIHDPQTSGGLLFSAQPQYAEKIVTLLKEAFPGTSIIGEVLPATEKAIAFV